MSNLIKMIDAEVRILKGKKRGIESELRGLEKARAALAPAKVLTKGKKKRKPSRRAKGLNKVDKGLSTTILTMLKQQPIEPGYLGLKATDIVKVLENRGFLFTSKFPSRSVSGLLTIMYKFGKVDRTPQGKPRIYHYKAVVRAPIELPGLEAPTTRPTDKGAAEGLAKAEGGGR
jgi:hypothetical protein